MIDSTCVDIYVDHDFKINFSFCYIQITSSWFIQYGRSQPDRLRRRMNVMLVYCVCLKGTQTIFSQNNHIPFCFLLSRYF